MSMVAPASGGVRPRSTRASVVLPLPDSPTRPRASPGRMLRETSTTPLTGCPSWRKVLLRCSTRTRGAPTARARLAIFGPASTVGNRCAFSWKKQRLVRPPSSSKSWGSCCRQTSWTRPQRSAKTHPGMFAPIAGGRPGIVSSRPWLLLVPQRGTARSSPTVYG